VEDRYFIIYNGCTDFFSSFYAPQAKEQIADLIKQGFAQDDIKLFKATEIGFAAEVTAKIEFKE